MRLFPDIWTDKFLTDKLCAAAFQLLVWTTAGWGITSKYLKMWCKDALWIERLTRN